ncbi:MAG TPA: hypothetical protein DCF63_13495, partial [Planctomycetaceae bacterium]|nr:hypothetical protein [Planctomycetaceae bacterium]
MKGRLTSISVWANSAAIYPQVVSDTSEENDSSMATPSQRRLQTTSIRRFGSGQETLELPSLTELQTKSYELFLQEDLAPEKRKNLGLEAVLREIFPIESYDKQVSLEYLRYELGKPRYTPTECRQLRLTYGKPMKVWLRLNREQPIEE